MDKQLEKLINPSWLTAIRRLESQTSITALAFKESEAMKSALKLSDTAKLASLAFSESELMKSVRNISETTRLASLAFRDTEALKSIEKLTESSRLASLAFQESEAIQSIRKIAESSKIASTSFKNSSALKELQSISKTSQFATIILQQSEAAQQLANLSKLSSFNALASLTNSPFAESISLGRNLVTEGHEEIDKGLIELDSQISAEIGKKTDFNDLPERTKKILIYIYHYYLLPIILAAFSAYLMNNAGEARKELESVSTTADVRNFVRSANSKFDRSALRGFRVTTANSLNFREFSSVKSQIIATLPVGTLVEVIDGSNRSWLLVEVEINGTLEQGWIFRRYTTYFK